MHFENPQKIIILFLVPCDESEFQCKNGLCIDRIDRCNGHRDCYDASDELKCDSCQAGAFQ